MKSKLSFFIDELSNTVNHILYKFFLWPTESSSIWNIKDTIICFSVLTMNTSNLNIIFVCNLIEKLFVFHQFWKFNMNRCTESSSKIGWAWSDITKMIVMCKFTNFWNMSNTSAESIKDGSNVSTLFHWNDSQLIFFIYPNEESLCVIMVNTSSWWPISIEITCFQKSITFFE